MIGTKINTGSFVYMLVDSSDTAGIVRLFVIEVVRAERVENKIDNWYRTVIHLSFLGTSIASEYDDNRIRWTIKHEILRFI